MASAIANRPNVQTAQTRRVTTSSAQQTNTAANNVTVNTGPADVASVSSGAQTTNNPFESMGVTSAKVEIANWEPGQSGVNSSVSAALMNQGYTQEELFAKDDNGKTLIDRVSAANDLKNPNLVHPGDSLVIPTKTQLESKAEAGETAATTATTATSGIEAMSGMSNQEVEDYAFMGKDYAQAGFGKLGSEFANLPEADQNSMKDAMLFEAASASGLHTVGTGDQQRNMTSAEIREKTSGYSSEQWDAFKGEVNGWVGQNEVDGQRAWALGAVGWLDGANGAPPSNQVGADARNNIYEGAMMMWEGNGAIYDAATELNSRQPGMGSGLYQALNQPAPE